MKFFPAILFFLLSVSLKAQKVSAPDSVKILLDTTISIMKKKALHADDINWNKLQQELYVKTSKVRTVKEAGFAFTRLFDELKDVHGVFYYKDTFFKSTVNPKNLHLINEVTLNEVKKGPRIVSNMISPDIAYLRIPVVIAQDTASVLKVANRLNDSLIQMLKQNPEGVIIDLRLNQGGNMYPMVAGLHSLFNDGILSAAYTQEARDLAPEVFFKGNSLISPYYTIPLNHSMKNTSIPVAVLIGPSTASAGECTAASLTFRQNVRFIGEETMGLTTTNDGFMLMPPDVGFNLSVGVLKDAKGNKLYDVFRPEIHVPGGDNFSDLTQDKKIEKAIEWINTIKK